MNKIYNVYQQIGNFGGLVFTSDNFYEVQDFLENKRIDAGVDPDDEAELALFYSYFSIEEKEA